MLSAQPARQNSAREEAQEQESNPRVMTAAKRACLRAAYERRPYPCGTRLAEKTFEVSGT